MKTTNRITTPLQLRKELARTNKINETTAILRNCEWKLVNEMRKTLLDARLFTGIGTRNDHLLTICSMLMEWVKTFYGEFNADQAKRYESKTINELLLPHDMLYKCAVADSNLTNMQSRTF